MEQIIFGIQITAVGMGTVFAVLGLIALMVSWIGRLDRRWQRLEEQRGAPQAPPEPRIDELTAVLIAAACATYLGGRFRVRSVRRLPPAEATGGTWSAQGRAVLLGSHVITRRSSAVD